MGFATVKSQKKITPYVVELVADTEADIKSLPTHYAPGSKCRVIENSSVYILNTQSEWKKQAAGSGTGGGGGETTIEGSLATEDDINALFPDLGG